MSLIEAIEIKRKMYFEFENAPYHCLDVEVSKPTARGGQTLVRLKMRNLITRAVFDRTFKAGEKFAEPDLVKVEAVYQYADSDGYHFMDQETYDTITLTADQLREAAIESFQRQIEVDEPEEDVMTLLTGNSDAPAEDDMSEERLLRALMEAQGEN